MYRIFIVEDDTAIAMAIENFLSNFGYTIRVVQDFNNVLNEFLSFDPQLVLMDISLPFYNGYHWCTQIRTVSRVPILFLSSASDNMNIVMALNMGGDDFISKPFDLNILLVKIQATLRRAYSFQGQVTILSHKGMVLNLGDATITYETEKAELTKNEFRILQVLMENPGHTVSRETLMKRLWEDESFIDDNTLTVNIARLRKKLEEIGLPDLILTKKGLGYMIPE
ncbi:response regulator transcription factor [Anaerolentibacter hominis]|uniref:response regulator transcription factor n=1 Tax=Anaerolentibacter hominis TaxID=3079009 RepID=UPI0031B81E53